MKGITPVIAIILLLLITVAMVGFAMVWFQRFVATAGQQTQENLQAQLDQQSKLVSIENIDNSGAESIVSVKNKGTKNLLVSELAFFVDSSRVSAEGCSDAGTPVDIIVPGATVECALNTFCGTDSRLKVTAPGNPDESICP